MRRASSFLLWACLVLLCPAARAGDDPAAQAQHLFLEGRKSYAAGKYEEAALLFERANELAPHPSVAFNAATAWDQAGNAAYAADSYQQALEGQLDKISQERAKKRLKELESRLGVIELSAPRGTEAKLNGRVQRSFPVRVHVPAGSASVQFTLPDGGASEKQIDVTAGTRASLDLTPTSLPARPREQPVPSSRSVERSSHARQWQIAGWAAVGVSAGLGVTSAILWNKAKSERDSLIEGDASARGRAQTLETWTNVTLISSVVLGAAGVTVLVLRPGESKEQASLSLRVGRSVTLSGTF